MAIQIATAQNVGVDYELASVGDRIAAQLIDYAIYLLWFMAMGAAALILSGLGLDVNTYISFSFFALVVFGPVLLCPLLCEYFMDGQTLGKKALKIKVARLDGGGATLSSYLLRYVLIIVDISLFSGIVAVLTIIINGKGQRLGDIAAGTTVIKLARKVHLNDIGLGAVSEHHQIKYTQVEKLKDRDMVTIRKVLARGDEQLEQATADKVAFSLQIYYTDPPRDFLMDILSDYQHLALTESNSE